MIKVKIFLWGINQDKKLIENMCQKSVNTANHYKISINYLGIGTKFVEHKQRLGILKTFLPKLDKNTIIILMDGSDTLFNDNLENIIDKFLKKNTKIFISAEKGFTYQYPQYKKKFDTINEKHIYKYVNAGTFMGYAGNILNMINDLFEIDKKISANDQGLLGIWVHENIHNTSLVKMDVDTEIFWVTTGDWKKILSDTFDNSNIIINPNTLNRPGIIHYTGKGDWYLGKGYEKLYNCIMK